MPTPIQGELVRHHNQPFYSQKSQPKFFWLGCTTPLLILIVAGFFVVQGAMTSAGIGLIRTFLLVVFAYLVIQFIFGGGLFIKSRSSLGKGLLVGAGVIFVVLLLGLIGLFSTLGQLLG